MIFKQGASAIADLFKRLFYSPEHYARSIGVKVGKRCTLSRFCIYSTEPYLIEIGDDVLISQNASFIAHDGGVHVLVREIPSIDVFGKIKVGSNTFIGHGVTILPGVTIGNNCVIGASSVVSKDVPDNTVAAGVPCRFISTIAEYKERMSKYNAGTGHLSDREKRKIIESLPDDRFIKKESLTVSGYQQPDQKIH